MNDAANSLLPSGFFDLLPPDARQQRLLFQRVLDCFASFGYQEVSPPLMEFEASLLAEKSNALTSRTFRLMDPLSREMMGIRSDMTMQVARIATARLSDQPKPLRLCYAGTCLRVAGEGLRRERQFMQAGAELIGSDTVAADIEILRMAVSAILPLELGEITIDINLPQLTTLLLEELPADLRPYCHEALDHKDRASLSSLKHPLIPAIIALLEVTGCEDPTTIHIPGLPEPISQLLSRWIKRVTAIKAAGIPARLTFDPLEQKGFEYHIDLAFSIFASRVESEIGRGGRYLLNDKTAAIGLTFYLNPLRYAMAAPPPQKHRLIPYGTPPEESERLRKEGWVTIHELEADKTP